MNRYWWAGASALVLIVQSVPGDDRAKAGQPDRTITVMGNAEVKAPPNQAQITLGVRSFQKDLAEAKKENDAKISKLLGVFSELKIDPSNYCTTDINVSSEYAENEVGNQQKDKFLGYTVTNHLSVTLDDLSLLSPLILKSIQAGANEIEDLSFGTTKLLDSRNEARRLAMRAARDKAVLLAGEIGQNIGKARTINEASSESSGFARAQVGGLGGGRFLRNSGDDDSREIVASGQLEIRATVWVTFDLE